MGWGHTATFKVSWRGKELKDLLKNITVEQMERVVERVASDARTIVHVSRPNAPGTSITKESIKADVVTRDYGTKIYGAVYTETHDRQGLGYGGMEEVGHQGPEGHGKAKPAPFLRPAMMANQDALGRALENTI
jgi:hypothetical protein